MDILIINITEKNLVFKAKEIPGRLHEIVRGFPGYSYDITPHDLGQPNGIAVSAPSGFEIEYSESQENFWDGETGIDVVNDFDPIWAALEAACVANMAIYLVCDRELADALPVQLHQGGRTIHVRSPVFDKKSNLVIGLRTRHG